MSKNEFDVIVVGAGAVGLAAALGFAQQNKRVALLERAEQFMPQPSESEYDLRVFAISHASEKLLSNVNAWDAIAQRRCAYTDMNVWNNTGRVTFSCEDIHRRHLGSIVEHNVLVHALVAQLSSHPNIECRLGVTIQHAEGLDSATPVLTLDEGTVLSASLVVAADGGQSAIRQFAGIDAPGVPYKQKGVVATLQTERAHEYTAWQRFLPTGPLAYLPLPDLDKHSQAKHCSIVWSADDSMADELMALNDAEFEARVANAFEYTLGAVTLTGQRAAFPLVHRHAQSYVQQGLALVGDAAHVIHPLAGQGMNLGFLDVATLLDECKQAGRVNHWPALKRYQRRRRLDNELTLQSMSALKALFGSSSELVDIVRNKGFSLVDKTNGLKRHFAKHAAGLFSDL